MFMIINARAASMKGTQLTCAKMRLSSPSQYCVQLRSRAPTSAEGERNNLEKLSHFLFNTQPFRLTTQSVQDNIPSSLILPGLQLPWCWGGDTGVAGGHLRSEPLSILRGLALLSAVASCQPAALMATSWSLGAASPVTGHAGVWGGGNCGSWTGLSPPSVSSAVAFLFACAD